MKISIPCPGCLEPVELDTDASQTCDVHHYHAQAGDRVTCARCRIEWIARGPSALLGTLNPRNRDIDRGVDDIDRSNDVWWLARITPDEATK